MKLFCSWLLCADSESQPKAWPKATTRCAIQISGSFCYSYAIKGLREPRLGMRCPISLTPVADLKYPVCIRNSAQHALYELRELCQLYRVAGTDSEAHHLEAYYSGRPTPKKNSTTYSARDVDFGPRTCGGLSCGLSCIR